MGVPYTLVRFFEGKDPEAISRGDRSVKQQARFLMNKSRMKGLHLGACLDSCRWGFREGVMYEMNGQNLVKFILNWKKQNKDNFQELYHEKEVDLLYTKFELPYINHDTCPRDEKHTERVFDTGGRVRCGHLTDKLFKPSFTDVHSYFDAHSEMMKAHLWDSPPEDSIPDDAYDENGNIEEFYQDEEEKYNNARAVYDAEDKEPQREICYSILSEEGLVMPLELIIKRLNSMPETKTVYCYDGPGHSMFNGCTTKRQAQMEANGDNIYPFCSGHEEPTNRVQTYGMDGWDLAFYVQKWHEQVNGQAPAYGLKALNPTTFAK
ncbi:hypothetical protein HN695_02670 [Candidatus Woesearchaeota archaeon]|jgi:hypothetical protein|nr:hypothetical protein [Candidatus Woesearchaeota archaeon]MBT5271982.1 hypothetical protein [Candidatus Woesearchaeota archaeon]MBT6040898.1 hypothetical protein [Candidatus Woesearchaeota archaeon]MBT6336764.1 hypothetical protein [Candidatus Woesearchaeota archaeon]MBT7927215.1 hypothetical protein [Candidatus Woesearchaeota archaeon]